MLQEMGIANPVSNNRKEEIETLCTSVNPVRLKNNPVHLDNIAIRQLYEVIVK